MPGDELVRFRMARVYIETFGCQMNEADSQYIAQRALSAGYSITAEPHDASVIVLNTCTVRENAERRAYGRMTHLGVLKAANPQLKLIVTGCLAEQDRDRMQRRVPHVDAVFGTSELASLAEVLQTWRADFQDTEAGETQALLQLGGQADCITDVFSDLRAFVTVQRGCSYYCTFCIVPHVRGRFDHRPMGDILRDVNEKVCAGAREIMLVGQTVNSYRDPSGADFGTLVKAVGAVEGLERLSFISPHPKDFNEKVVRDLAAVPQLNPRLHLPLQSASDPVLRRMNRKYTLAQYEEKLALFREHLPHWAITTDIIVGFPGETDDDFGRTLRFCERVQFAQAFMFRYSPRRGTPAANWEQVPAEVSAERFQRLADVQNAATLHYHEEKVGTTVRALIVGPSKKDAAKLAAKTTDNVTVIAAKPQDFDTARYAATPWLDVEVHGAHVWGCDGTIVSRAARHDDGGVPVRSPLLDLLPL
ncbi:MAG: tRNA (N6-isopentenyl adenosine(37)-C2)-methylthiotransferase MiaB [Candidatus Eremiobacteraeota bacterium]|nr:tRNA (N6-isopentenyl adenosine(37)-C2)-methylthiotransferase MiaB [Candidatus Eremiobacteraeota bacterium]